MIQYNAINRYILLIRCYNSVALLLVAPFLSSYFLAKDVLFIAKKSWGLEQNY